MSLKDLRQNIDEIDQRLVSILSERSNIVKQIGALKHKNNANPFAPDREKAVYDKITKLNQEAGQKIPDFMMRNIWREIMSASIAMEKPIKVAYLGPEASFTHLAAKSKFGNSIETVAQASIPEVFKAVSSGTIAYGVVPAENSMEGSIYQTLDMLADNNLKICADIYCAIHQNLAVKSDTKIKRIYSHPQPFAQCRKYLANHYPDAELIETASTTKAAQLVVDEEGSAAICSIEAVELYGLKTIKTNIEDDSKNTTRFFVIADTFAGATGKDRTSIIVEAHDEVGALINILSPFKTHNVTLTKIESRPLRTRAWDYIFFIDFNGHAEDPNVANLIKELSQIAKQVQVLGSFPITTPQNN